MIILTPNNINIDLDEYIKTENKNKVFLWIYLYIIKFYCFQSIEHLLRHNVHFLLYLNVL